MHYLLHVGILLGACFMYYRLVLQRETHFGLNRWLLIGCVAASFALPLITVPAAWSLRPAVELTTMTERVNKPVESLNLPDEISTTVGTIKVDKPAALQAQSTAPFNWLRALRWVYLAGMMVFGIHFLIQIGTLVVRMIRYPGYDLGQFRLVELDEEFAPYSFWNRIFLNPKHYDPDTFHRIVEHEQIHVTQRHSLDILLAELLIVVQWFNPFAWLYRAAIEDNLEFLTDAEMLAQGTDPVAYQLSLVQVAVPNHPQGLTSNYNQTFLEKRIKMMKAKKSTNRSGWKYLALLPLLLFSMLQLNAVSQPVQDLSLTVATTPAVHSVEVTIPEIPVNPSIELNVEPAVRAEPNTQTKVQAKLAAKYPEIAREMKSWTATIEGDEVCFNFMVRSEEDNWRMQNSRCFLRASLGTLPGTSMGEFSIKRYSGELQLKGIFEGNDGVGKFEFEPAAAFVNLLKKEGFGTYKDAELFLLFLSDFDADYVNYLKKRDEKIDRDELIKIAIFFDDREELEQREKDLKRDGYGKQTLDELVNMQIHGVTSGYIAEMNDLGFGRLSLDEITSAKIHNLDAEFIAELQSVDISGLDFDAAKSFAIHGVTAKYVWELRSLGFDDLSQKDILNARIHGMSAKFLKGMKETGLPMGSFEDVLPLKIHGVTPEFIKGIRDAGFPDLKLDDFVSARIHGVSPRFMESYKDLDLGKISFKDYVSLKIHGVSSEYIRKNRDRGEDVSDFVSMKIHGR